jgi:hypothetical protein
MDDLVRAYGLSAHPEGGYFRETYRSAALVPGTTRALCTAIYFLLPAGTWSRLHRIGADEIWHFYEGGPLVVAELDPAGQLRETRLGRDRARGEVLQHVVPAGTWFGAYPDVDTAFSLVGCTVSPGFLFEDFELARRDALLASFGHVPGAVALIQRLTDPSP